VTVGATAASAIATATQALAMTVGATAASAIATAVQGLAMTVGATAAAAIAALVDTTVGATAAGAIADAVWDEQVDGSVTGRQSMRLQNAALGGKASGLETTEATYRDLADTKDRIVATVDADGNRTAVTRDLT
jgi:hypothetical protein